MIDEIGRIGGDKYESALTSLLYGATEAKAYKEAIDALLPLY